MAPAFELGRAGRDPSNEIWLALRFTSRDRANIRDAADPRRLLPGENPATGSRQEIEHWIARYTELAAFNHEMIARLAGRLASVDREEDESEAMDLPLARAHALRIRLRLYYWKARGRQLRQRSLGMQAVELGQPVATSITT